MPAIFAVANDGMTHGRAMDAQLVGAACQRLEFEPSGGFADLLDHAVARFGRLPFFLVNVHFLAMGAGLFGQGRIDCALFYLGNADDQRPVNLLSSAAGKALGVSRRCTRSASDQQNAAGVLVEPVDKARARQLSAVLIVAIDKSIEQAIDMAGRLCAALGGKAGGLVEDQSALALHNHHRMRAFDLFSRQGTPRFGATALLHAAGWNAQLLALG